MRAANADWSEMWVWRASTRRAETARMAILTADHLFITGDLDRRRIADLHDAARLGSERIQAVLEEGPADEGSVELDRADITSVVWHRTTRTIDIGRDRDDPLRLTCAELESTEEIGRGLQRALAPSLLPISEPIPRAKMIRFELFRGKGRNPLTVFAGATLIAVACLTISLYWLALLAAAVAAVALVAVASVIRDADHSVPFYRVDVPHRVEQPSD